MQNITGLWTHKTAVRWTWETGYTTFTCSDVDGHSYWLLYGIVHITCHIILARGLIWVEGWYDK
jgi:hypothetical protein